MRQKFMTKLSLALTLLLLGGSANVSALPVFASFGSGSSTSVSFTLNGIAGTVTETDGAFGANSGFNGTFNPTGSANFPGAFYSPTPPTNLSWLGVESNGIGQAADAIVATHTLTFTSPVTDPTLHFLNLDASQQIFTGATDGGGTSITGSALAGSFSRLSGNNAFEANILSFQGSNLFAVNATPSLATNGGCESNAGGNPSGACGSVSLSGTYSSLTWVATDDNSATGGDGWGLQISVNATTSAVPEPGSFGLLALGLVVLASVAAARKQATD